MSRIKAVMLLAEGFEEIEAVTVADILRRAGIELDLLGLTRESYVRGAHGISLEVDDFLVNRLAEPVDLLILPGGMPGARNLAASSDVLRKLKQAAKADAVIAAICAGPTVLAKAGLLTAKRVTCYPGFEQALTGAVYTGQRIEVDGRIITASGPGSAIEFGFAIVTAVGLPQMAEQLRSSMLV